MALLPSQAFYLLINNRGLASMSLTMAQVYKQHQDEDGFLYMTYASQEMFGRWSSSCFRFYSRYRLLASAAVNTKECIYCNFCSTRWLDEMDFNRVHPINILMLRNAAGSWFLLVDGDTWTQHHMNRFTFSLWIFDTWSFIKNCLFPVNRNWL